MSVNQYGRVASRRWRAPVTIGVAVAALAAGGLGVALADTNSTKADAASIVCPDVASELPAIPARAQAEVDRNLALLQKQIDEANARLVSSVGQGGPNFVQNAILGPLQGKRNSTIERIVISIGRGGEKPVGLERLAACALSTDAAPSAPRPRKPLPGRGSGSPAEEAAPPAEEADEAAPAAGSISCPDVASQLPAIPAQAQAEVDRNLALLQKQIDEANTRLANTVGQGGPNFVQNAILGPLEDKRVAAINRIATAIGRIAARPAGLDALAPCALSD